VTTWVESNEELRDLVAALGRVSAMAIDTESDSLHNYREKVCLIQLAGEGVAPRLADPLCAIDLSPLAPLLADSRVIKVLHGADYDVTTLKRDFGWELRPVFDTMIAARFLGMPAIGLQAVTEAELGVKLSKSSQKDDWSRRPLRPVQEAYAQADVEHLLALHQRLRGRLEECGRLAWVVEECEAVSALPAARRERDPEAWRRIKGVRKLQPPALRILKELHAWREAVGASLDRPTFKVIGNDGLLALATAPPISAALLRRHKAWRPSLERESGALLAALEAGVTSREDVRLEPGQPRAVIPPAAQRRGAALKRWRVDKAKALGLDISVVLPQRLIDALAGANPTDADALSQVDGLRRWRVDAFGGELLGCLRTA
jgi:ribonuclease D